jgi:tetratricopeptide (TPR) repeat protein
MGFEVYRPEALISRAGAYLSAGRVEEALRLARQGLDLSRAGKQRGCEAATLHILGEIQARQHPPGTVGAEESYRQALVLATELGMRPLVAHCHLGLGKLYRRTGQHQQAHEHLATATTMYREMDMRFWLEQAEAEMRELA